MAMYEIEDDSKTESSDSFGHPTVNIDERRSSGSLEYIDNRIVSGMRGTYRSSRRKKFADLDIISFFSSSFNCGLYLARKGEQLFVLKEFDSSARDAYRKEKMMLKKLNHERIVPMDLERSGHGTIVMPCCGHSFYEVVRGNKIPERRALLLFQQVLEGLEYLATLGIVHRDLKPGNIIYVDGSLKLIDFGSSLHMGDEIVRSDFTPAYAPLEVHLGLKTVDPSFDIWSAGCLLYEMLNAKPLFRKVNLISLITEIIKKLGIPSLKDYEGLVLEHLNMVRLRAEGGIAVRSEPCLYSDSLILNRFLCEFFVHDPRKRITASEAIRRIKHGLG